jgi:hypothetical protein
MLAEVAFVEVHVSVTFPPPAGREVGLAPNVPVGAGVVATVTVAVYVLDPLAFVSVRVKVFVAVTLTVVEPERGSVPTP